MSDAYLLNLIAFQDSKTNCWIAESDNAYFHRTAAPNPVSLELKIKTSICQLLNVADFLPDINAINYMVCEKNGRMLFGGRIVRNG